SSDVCSSDLRAPPRRRGKRGRFIMARTTDFAAVFRRLRAIMKPLEKHLVVRHDDGKCYYLNTTKQAPNGAPMFFGAVRLGKAYVSYHLIPVYCCPDLLDEVSPELRRRMQGKSCFNFKQEDAALFKELASLTRTGLARLRTAGLA